MQNDLLASSQAVFRFLKRQLSFVTRLSPASLALRLLALGATALLVVLMIAGVQTIARSARSINSERTIPHAASVLVSEWATVPATPDPPAATTKLAQVNLSAYAPKQQAAPADPTNYGDRYAVDIYGNPVRNAPLIVLHETVGTADSALNTFQTPHQDENLQVSYHTLIRRDGTVVYIVPPQKRAFGAGNSAFSGANGEESVKTHHAFPASVNNFSYHISLETPDDGENDATTHSGYSDAQYRSLAWLVAHTSVPDPRITTHRAVDRSGSRIDPRSFDAERFFTYLRTMPRPSVNLQSAG